MEVMTVLLPYYILSAAISVCVCICAPWSGWLTAAELILGFAAAIIVLLALTLLFYAVLALMIDQRKPQTVRSPFFAGILNFGLGLLTAVSRIRLHVTGLEKLPEGRWLLVCNHRSNFDPIVTGWALRKYQLAFISKPENLRRPIVGQIIHKACYLPIDRENDRAALRTIQTAADLMKRDEVNFAVYPEGTRNPTDELLPFRNGAFKIAQKAKVPVVVAVVRGTDEVQHRAPWKHADVDFEILAVLDAETVQERKTTEIGDEVRKRISEACR